MPFLSLSLSNSLSSLCALHQSIFHPLFRYFTPSETHSQAPWTITIKSYNPWSNLSSSFLDTSLGFASPETYMATSPPSLQYFYLFQSGSATCHIVFSSFPSFHVYSLTTHLVLLYIQCLIKSINIDKRLFYYFIPLINKEHCNPRIHNQSAYLKKLRFWPRYRLFPVAETSVKAT